MVVLFGGFGFVVRCLLGFCLVVFDVVCVAVFVHLFVMISWIAGVCLLLIDSDLVLGLVCIRWFVYADLLWG